MEHCIVDGKRCSKCCDIIILNGQKRMLSLMKSLRRGEFNSQDMEILRKISKRRAKKRNPYLVKRMQGKDVTFFTCKHFNGDGCGNYQERPKMCRDYPHYGRSDLEFAKQQYIHGPEYSKDCTYYSEEFLIHIQNAK